MNDTNKPLFYLTSRHGDTGTNVMFHNKGGAGYGTDLNNLALFTLDEAQKEVDQDIQSIPLLKIEVDKLSIKAVDCQYLDRAKNTPAKGERFIIQKPGRYNGNDISFQSKDGQTFDYSNAGVYSLSEALLVDGVIWSKSYLDSICRRTFQRENIKTRKMITGAGISYKKPRKKRPITGKERWNCPSCGKISWQFSPYDFEGCNDHMCDAWHFA